MSQGIVPSIELTFFRETCQPFHRNYADIFIRDIVLLIDSVSDGQASARFHWLKTDHPEACTIKTIRLFDLRLNARKFKQGLWDRYPSSKKKQPR